jgi:hypothetical protein
MGIPAFLSNQGRLGSLNVLTDKQNVVNPLKLIDSIKKTSLKKTNDNTYFDELLTANQNNFFS